MHPEKFEQTLTPKLLALDIDGTIVPEHTNHISPTVRAALKKAEKLVTICLVSARAWKDQKIIIDALHLPPSYHVVENGTKVINPHGEIEYTKQITHPEINEILTLTKHLYESVGLCIEGKWLPAIATPHDVVTTISLIAEREAAEQIPLLLKQLPTTYSITVGNHWSDPNLGVALISHKDASKSGGLAYVQQKLSILPEETIAVGDGASDVPLMAYAATKVAMGNAEAKLKSVANYIAPSVEEDGLFAVVEHFL